MAVPRPPPKKARSVSNDLPMETNVRHRQKFVFDVGNERYEDTGRPIPFGWKSETHMPFPRVDRGAIVGFEFTLPATGAPSLSLFPFDGTYAIRNFLSLARWH